MKKEKQLIANAAVEIAMNDCIKHGEPVFASGLRTCKAKVYENGAYYILESYNTVVAIISKKHGTCFDFLRKAYGYTTTSAQHIAKFRHDYGNGKTYTWRRA